MWYLSEQQYAIGVLFFILTNIISVSTNSRQVNLLEMKSLLQILKSVSRLPLICFICLIESPLKTMKNTFYFILKALFVLKIFKILAWLLGHVGKTAWLERQVFTSKFMMAQPG